MLLEMVRNLLTLGCLITGLTWQDARAATAGLKINATQPGVMGPVCVRAIIRQADGSYVAGEWGNGLGHGCGFGPGQRQHWRDTGNHLN